MNFCLSTATSSRCKRLVYTARLATILVPKAANKHPPSLTRRWRRERRPENAAASNVCMRRATSFVPTHWLFPSSLQMPITIGNQKVQANTMKAYRERQWQYNYNPCQLVHVSPGNALLISVCLLMLPMLGLAAEHVQLATMWYTKPINQWHLHEHHMTFHKAIPEQHTTCHGHSEWIDTVKYQVFVIPIQHLPSFPQPSCLCCFVFGQDDYRGGCGATATEMW